MPSSEVEIQVTPMLDMAFQLLTFFILTYAPAPVEGQYSMSLLPAAPAIDMNAPAPAETPPADSADIPPLLRTLTTSVYAHPDGTLDHVSVGEIDLSDLDQLRTHLKTIKADPTLPFDQAVIQADPTLSYSELMRVIDIFTGPGVAITRLSFAELRD
jgi:biopolymer transport protein ExbD